MNTLPFPAYPQERRAAPAARPYFSHSTVGTSCPSVDRFARWSALDTAVVHLAGALGKPVWVMLPFSPGWRWPLDRGDSPWYPTLRLYRQPRPGDWDRVAADLTALAAREARS